VAFALARSAARRAACGVRPRALVAATAPAGAAARLGGRRAASESAHAARRAAAGGTPAAALPPSAAPGVVAVHADAAAKSFEAAAAWERENGYGNSRGNAFPNFAAFLCDVLDRVAAAREAGGLDASALRRLRQEAVFYDDMLTPERCVFVVRA
jgi:hypothetical protein